jgi:hypothetical protein
MQQLKHTVALDSSIICHFNKPPQTTGERLGTSFNCIFNSMGQGELQYTVAVRAASLILRRQIRSMVCARFIVGPRRSQPAQDRTFALVAPQDELAPTGEQRRE